MNLLAMLEFACVASPCLLYLLRSLPFSVLPSLYLHALLEVVCFARICLHLDLLCSAGFLCLLASLSLAWLCFVLLLFALLCFDLFCFALFSIASL